MTINSTTHNKLISRVINSNCPTRICRDLRTLFLALSLAVVSIFAASALSSCSQESLDPQIGNLESFYSESQGLKFVAGDSIQRFATKVETYASKNPTIQTDPLWSEIIENIRSAAHGANIHIAITINSEWDGEITINF